MRELLRRHTDHYRPSVILENSTTIDDLTIEQLRIGEKVRLTGFAVEHRSGMDSHRDSLQAAIQGADIVIPEYFPPELSQMEQNPIFRKLLKLPVLMSTNYQEITPYFQDIADMAAQEGKRVTMVDPAFNEKFLAVRGAPLLAALVGSGMTLAGLSLQNQGMHTQGQVLTTTGSILALSGGASFGARQYEYLISHKPFKGIPSEAYLRRYIAAEGIMNTAKQLNTNDSAEEHNLLTIYPPSHWQVIKNLLQNHGKRERGYAVYSTALKAANLPSLLATRNYEWDGQSSETQGGEDRLTLERS